MFFTVGKINALSEEMKRKFQGLLPEVVKRLIVSSSKDIVNVRIPSQDDIWAPGFDGVVENKEENNYVAAGCSVWEFGTSTDSLTKINSDYKKRTNNPLGVKKEDATFYLVMPKIWAFDNQGVSITDWVKNKTEWKKVCVYDASVLCDWINKEPSVAAWLLEELFLEKELDFSTVSNAWNVFSQKTNPAFTYTMFCINRDEQRQALFEAINKQDITRIKSQTKVDSYGFCLASLSQDKNVFNTLPSCAFDNREVFMCFADFLINISNDDSPRLGARFLGEVLGRDKTNGNDETFPHEFIREILERGNQDINKNYIRGKFFSQSVRTVGDGSDQFLIADKYISYSKKLEIEYPITARLLISISECYRNEGKQDQVISEILSI